MRPTAASARTTSTGSPSTSRPRRRWARTWTALNHLHVGDRTYGGHRVDDIIDEWGTTRYGVETLPQVVTRGVLLDIAAVRGVSPLGAGDVITPADADAALDQAG